MPLVPCVWEGEEADVAGEEEVAGGDGLSFVGDDVGEDSGLDASCEAGEEEGGEGAALELGAAELLLLLPESSDGSEPTLPTTVEEGKTPATTCSLPVKGAPSQFIAGNLESWKISF